MDFLQSIGAFGKHCQSRGNWYWMVVLRNDVVERLLGEYKYAITTRKIKNPGAWLNDLWQRWGKPDK